MPSEHVGTWPHPRTKPRDRSLSYLSDGVVYTEHREAYPVTSYEAFLSVVSAIRSDCYVEDLLAFPWLTDALQDPRAMVAADGVGELLGIRVKRKSYAYWIGQSRVWHAGEICSQAWLDLLRGLFTHCRAGTYPTPGSLGSALWAASWRDCGGPLVSRPPRQCGADLRTHLIGGRVDTPGLGGRYDTLYEIDMRSAYASMVEQLPGGTATRIPRMWTFMQADNPDYVTWYACCDVFVPRKLSLGCFPVKDAQRSNQIDYPLFPGRYEKIWLWKEEAQRCKDAGIIVTPDHGWGWTSWLLHAAPWANIMDSLRATAPTPDIADMIKHAIVASIGRHGMQPYQYEMIHEDDARDGDQMVLSQHGDSPLTNFYIRKTDDPDNASLSHWYSFIMAKCRVALYDRMLAEQRQGNTIIASNYDGIYLKDPSRLPLGNELGQWRQKPLHNAYIPYARAIQSDEKIRMPGLHQG